MGAAAKAGNTDTANLGAEARRRRAVLAGLLRAVADLLGVDGARDAVVHLDVQLGQHVGCAPRPRSARTKKTGKKKKPPIVPS